MTRVELHVERLHSREGLCKSAALFVTARSSSVGWADVFGGFRVLGFRV